jgi:hypothetical protein
VEQAIATFERAINALLGLESLVSSVIVVIGCLSNLYDKALKVMGRSTLDRLVEDPPPARLPDQLSYEEIQAIVGHRLAWMYAEAGAIYRAADPVYPIPAAQLHNRVGHRPHQSFLPAFSAERLQAWRHSQRPIASLPSIADMFAMEPFGPEARSRGRPSGAAPPASSAAVG